MCVYIVKRKRNCTFCSNKTVHCAALFADGFRFEAALFIYRTKYFVDLSFSAYAEAHPFNLAVVDELVVDVL